jgi:hypothetical protein
MPRVGCSSSTPHRAIHPQRGDWKSPARAQASNVRFWAMVDFQELGLGQEDLGQKNGRENLSDQNFCDFIFWFRSRKQV